MAFVADAPADEQPAVTGRFVPDKKPGGAAPSPENPYSAKNMIGAAIEPSIALATGAAAAPISGLAGLATTIANGMGLTTKNPADVVHSVGSALTRQPSTSGGKTALGAISYPFEKVAEGADAAGDLARRGAGRLGASPEVAAAPAAYVNAGIQGLAQLIVGKGVNRAIPAAAGPKNPKAAVANAQGFTMTPEEIGAGPVAQAVSGIAGEPKLAKGVSAKNQPVYKKLVAQDAGLPAGSEISIDTLDGVRSSAGKAFEGVRDLSKSMGQRVQLDGQFYSELQQIVGDYAKAEIDFPGRKNSVMDMVERLRVKDADSSSVVSEINSLRKDAKSQYKAGDYEASFASMDAASALEQQLIRFAQSIGQPPDIVNAMIAARTQIAKTYAAQKALKGNDIDPQAYAKALARKAPLTGPGRTIAEFGRDFPRSAQPPSHGANMGAPTAWDLALAMMGGGKEMLMLGARPGARMALASPPVQSMMINRPNFAHGLTRGLPIGGFQQGQLPPPP